MCGKLSTIMSKPNMWKLVSFRGGYPQTPISTDNGSKVVIDAKIKSEKQNKTKRQNASGLIFLTSFETWYFFTPKTK